LARTAGSTGGYGNKALETRAGVYPEHIDRASRHRVGDPVQQGVELVISEAGAAVEEPSVEHLSFDERVLPVVVPQGVGVVADDEASELGRVGGVEQLSRGIDHAVAQAADLRLQELLAELLDLGPEVWGLKPQAPSWFRLRPD
jgi:hypothetical protein